jgi:pyruvate kinase
MTPRENPRRTKIVCTLGPATDSPERIGRLIQAGMDVARLNFSHGDHESHRRTIRTLRRLSVELGRAVGILQDLRGPKIRIGRLPDFERELKPDQTVFLVPGREAHSGDLPIDYPHLLEDVTAGDRILLADGTAELSVEAKTDQGLACRVLVGGVVHSNKGVNLPTSPLRIPAFTEKDRADLEVGLNEGVDFVALSFVRHEKDLEPVREILNRRERRPLLIAKLEKPQAIHRLDEILARVDGVMVARGDLGVEMPLEEVPHVQKMIITRARQSAKPVITATQMLRSMVSSPRPSRAEATDVANAVLDGTDALMLSEETALGEYPVESVRILHRIAKVTENRMAGRSYTDDPLSDLLPRVAASIGRSACRLAEELDAAAIVAGTASGSTARLIARFRPARPVVGLTPYPEIKLHLTLSWGVIPILVPPFSRTDDIFDLAGQWVPEHGFAGPGDRLVVTAGIPVGEPGTTNLVRVMEIE